MPTWFCCWALPQMASIFTGSNKIPPPRLNDSSSHRYWRDRDTWRQITTAGPQPQILMAPKHKIATTSIERHGGSFDCCSSGFFLAMARERLCNNEFRTINLENIAWPLNFRMRAAGRTAPEIA
ncbi:hypothetical protein TIFTF001_030394 [Ficus carica]|uniref:Uncharacterized protein n=1 Tax=Ficus carica TaxID=3494 RepID=A0AA88DT78_FICCA|nr:hypothetical protein TIFTF001_030394 [Ficus carica]